MGFFDFLKDILSSGQEAIIRKSYQQGRQLSPSELDSLIEVTDNDVKRRLLILIIGERSMYKAVELAHEYSYPARSFEVFTTVKETRRVAIELMRQLSEY
ncbi:hypothetical protein [Mailhella sp.]